LPSLRGAGVVRETPEDTPLVLTQAGGNGLTLIDPDGGAHALVVTLIARHGRASLRQAAGVTMVEGAAAAAEKSLTFTGGVEALNVALDGLTFVPEEDFTGNAAVCVEVGHTVRPVDMASPCVAAVVTRWSDGSEERDAPRLAIWLPITVTSVNDAPTIGVIGDRVPAGETPGEEATADDETADEARTGPIAFRIRDADTARDQLTVVVAATTDAVPDPAPWPAACGPRPPGGGVVGTEALRITLTASDGEATTTRVFRFRAGCLTPVTSEPEVVLRPLEACKAPGPLPCGLPPRFRVRSAPAEGGLVIALEEAEPAGAGQPR
jgi:hypothetical protein